MGLISGIAAKLAHLPRVHHADSQKKTKKDSPDAKPSTGGGKGAPRPTGSPDSIDRATPDAKRPTGGPKGARDGAKPVELPPNRERPKDWKAIRAQHKDDVTGTESSARRYHPEHAADHAPTDPPDGVDVKQQGDARVVTINIHQAVPGEQELGDEHETRKALEDVATYIRSIDADVVVVQEIDDDAETDGNAGVNEQARVLADLMEATDSAYTPAVRHADDAGTYGTGIFTRNGYTLGQAHNLDLPNGDVREDRGAGLAEVVAPEGQSFTMLYSHLTVGKIDKATRAAQIKYLGEVAEQVGQTGSVSYTDALTGAELTASGLPTDKIVVAGDMNAQHGELDDAMDGADLVNVRRSPYVKDLIAQAYMDPTSERGRAATRKLEAIYQATTIEGTTQIDHIYTRGMEVHDNFVGDIPEDALDEVSTDHKPVVTDLDLGSAPR